ncbi:hypothetical protein CIHG_05139 [Coccidioides immitis H538.4]|uniref:Uncharacterized protein n=2 Tax=Coccidioides immitis TaxID=5501 RepID=A0A0J8UIC7_COCIT|nr:hypothetical protein CIRG_00189 [Coccidioides immitis RMSCC 2394]KMU87198.1 hypothetical protein CIHG_05139 [Coccidioides immitis H538.4]
MLGENGTATTCALGRHAEAPGGTISLTGLFFNTRYLRIRRTVSEVRDRRKPKFEVEERKTLGRQLGNLGGVRKHPKHIRALRRSSFIHSPNSDLQDSWRRHLGGQGHDTPI